MFTNLAFSNGGTTLRFFLACHGVKPRQDLENPSNVQRPTCNGLCKSLLCMSQTFRTFFLTNLRPVIGAYIYTIIIQVIFYHYTIIILLWYYYYTIIILLLNSYFYYYYTIIILLLYYYYTIILLLLYIGIYYYYTIPSLSSMVVPMTRVFAIWHRDGFLEHYLIVDFPMYRITSTPGFVSSQSDMSSIDFYYFIYISNINIYNIILYI